MFRTPATGLIVSVLCACTSGLAVAQRVLLVDLDDVGGEFIAQTPTPVLDAVAAAGLHLTNFYVAPLCSPTRARMNLGARSSHPSLLLGHLVKHKGDYAMPVGPLEPLAHVVAGAGFTTAKLGKWHLSPVDDFLHPQRSGWQHYAGVMSNLPKKKGGYFHFGKVVDGSRRRVRDRYLTTDETDDAIACVRSGVNLISLSYHAVHKPFHEPPRHLYQGPPPADDRERAQAALQAVDAELGRLLGEALPRGYMVLIFCDNGTAVDIGGVKGSVREGAVRTPCFTIGCGVCPGSVDSLVAVEDVYARVLDLFGLAGGPTRGPDSITFAPQLLGSTHPEPRRVAYTEMWKPNGADPRCDPIDVTWRRAMRTQRYKLMRDQKKPGDCLYDLLVDPQEQHDLLTGDLDATARWTLHLLLRLMGAV